MLCDDGYVTIPWAGGISRGPQQTLRAFSATMMPYKQLQAPRTPDATMTSTDDSDVDDPSHGWTSSPGDPDSTTASWDDDDGGAPTATQTTPPTPSAMSPPPPPPLPAELLQALANALYRHQVQSDPTAPADVLQLTQRLQNEIAWWGPAAPTSGQVIASQPVRITIGNMQTIAPGWPATQAFFDRLFPDDPEMAANAADAWWSTFRPRSLHVELPTSSWSPAVVRPGMTAGRISLTSSERVQLWESKFPAQSVAVCPRVPDDPSQKRHVARGPL